MIETERYAVTVFGAVSNVICSLVIPVTIGTSCNSTGAGTAKCQEGIADAICHSITNTCECSSGEVYAPALDTCEPESSHASCATCLGTGGRCYDVEDDGSPTGCACPPSKESSDPSNSLTVGCDVGNGKQLPVIC